MKRALVLGWLLAGCTLNPQPLPPERAGFESDASQLNDTRDAAGAPPAEDAACSDAEAHDAKVDDADAGNSDASDASDEPDARDAGVVD